MSFLALPQRPAQTQAPLDPRAHWITPEKQLEILSLPIAEEITRLSLLILDVAKLVAQYGLDESLTNWYTAHERLNSLPKKKIPPLPTNIDQIMNGKCPIYDGQMKDDGTAYMTKNTHFLSLVSEEFGNLSRFERDILKPYGERKYSKENPLRFRYFIPKARKEHADVPFPATHWILMANDVLPGSKGQPWNKQVALVNALSQKACVDYEIPTLQQSFAGITTDMVATGKRRYQAGNDQNGKIYTYTLVKETTEDHHLVVGGFAPSGVSASTTDDYGYFVQARERIGISVLRKF